MQKAKELIDNNMLGKVRTINIKIAKCINLTITLNKLFGKNI